MKHFITIAIFTFPHEYAVLKLLLDQHRIQYFFKNETMVNVLPFYSHALGGIHLKVHEKDKNRAQKILNSLENNSSPLKKV